MFQLWVKEEFGELYNRVDCPDLDSVKRELEKSVRNGGQPVLTTEVHYEVGIIIGGESGEIAQSETEHNQGAGGEGNGEVRRGDEEITQ